MDRGFLFGDGIYEATPSYNGKTVALGLHLQRMNNGLQSIGIHNPLTDDELREVAKNISEKNGDENLGIYFHVSRGNEGRRFHGFPTDTKPTVFAMVIDIDPHPPVPDRTTKKGLKVTST